MAGEREIATMWEIANRVTSLFNIGGFDLSKDVEKRFTVQDRRLGEHRWTAEVRSMFLLAISPSGCFGSNTPCYVFWATQRNQGKGNGPRRQGGYVQELPDNSWTVRFLNMILDTDAVNDHLV